MHLVTIKLPRGILCRGANSSDDNGKVFWSNLCDDECENIIIVIVINVLPLWELPEKRRVNLETRGREFSTVIEKMIMSLYVRFV